MSWYTGSGQAPADGKAATLPPSLEKRYRHPSGYRADLVHFDDQFRVHNTWLVGERRQHL